MSTKPRTDDLLPSHPGEPYPYPVQARVEEKDLQGKVVPSTFVGTGLAPIQIVGALPALPDSLFPQGYLVFLTTDNKLYRSTGTAWTVAVPTTDLTGTITTAQVADGAITTVKIGDTQVSTAKLIDGAVTTAKIGNQAVTATQLADSTVTQVKMSSGLFVPVIVSSLPVLPSGSYPQGATVVLTSDNKLYRSTGVAWTVAVPTVDLTGQVTTAQITNLAVDASKLAASAVDLTKFASGLRPVEVVSSLGAAGTQGRTVFLTTDNKLYRDTGSAWVATVPTTDLTGTITSAQIAAGAVGVAAFAAGLRPVEIVSSLPGAGTQGRTVFLTTDNKLYRDTGAAWVATVPTTDLTGTIATTQIAAGAVTNAKLAALAVDLNQLSATMINTLSFADARNRLMNAGFEDDMTYWQQSAGASVVNNSALAKSGNKYLEITASVITDVNLNTNNDGTGASRYFEIPPGAVIKYGGWAMVASGTGTAIINAVTADKDKANRTGHTVSTAAGVWTFISGTFTPSATDKYHGIRVTLGSPTGSCTVRFDDLFCYVMMPGTDIVANTITAAQIAAGTITANEIAALTIVAGNIAAGAITTAKIGAGQVTANEIAANTITAAKIAAGTITATEIAAATITGAKIAATTITAANIAAGTITANEIAADTITAGQIAAAAITSSELAAGAVIAGKIAAGTIVAADIAAATITGAKIAANTITAGNIVAGTITATEIAADTITAGQIAAGAITASELAANAVTAVAIAANTITAAKMAARSISAASLFVGSYDNLISDPGFEQNATITDPWAVNASGGGTWSIVTSNMRSGARTAQFNPAGQTLTAEIIANGPTATQNMAATQGDQFYFEAYVRKVGAGTPPNAQLVINFRDSTGTIISSVSSTNTTPTTSYALLTASGTAPATTAFVTFKCICNAVGGATELVNFDDCYARRMVVGSIIVDGTITATKIAANTITAAQIAAGTITSTEIGADVITAGNIAAGAIGASELAAGAVVAGKIAAGTIVAADIAASTITSAQIAATTITAANIAAGTITANEIAAGTITAAKLAITQLSAIAADLGTVTAGTISGTTVTVEGLLRVQAGTSGLFARVVGTLAQAANQTTSSTTDVTVLDYLLKANSLSANGQAIRCTVRGGLFSSSGLTRTCILTITLNGTTMATYSMSFTALNGTQGFEADVVIARTGAAAQTSVGGGRWGTGTPANNVQRSTSTISLTADQHLQVLAHVVNAADIMDVDIIQVEYLAS